MNYRSSGRLEAGLYVVATPIGHLSDLGQRAREVLCAANVVAAEDTRVSRVLLDSIGASTPMIAAHEHNEQAAAAQILARIRDGEAIALISDAGTPGVSDPGARIVRAIREAGCAVFAVPGPSAPAALVSIAGLRAESFCFIGFLPTRARARDKVLSQWTERSEALVLFESPHRIAATLDAIARVFGDERPIVIGRELTKRFEESVALPAGSASQWLSANANRLRGEFVIAIDSPVRQTQAGDDSLAITMPLEQLLGMLLDHVPPSVASRLAQSLTGRARRALYERLLELAALRAHSGDD